MPRIRVNGVELYFEDTGGQNRETIVFSHGLFLSSRAFDPQVAALSDRYRCIAYDHRGQGRSEITKNGYDMETIYEDAAHLIQALDAAPCHFVGSDMGGVVAMRLAARRPDLIKSLVLIHTSPDTEPESEVARYRTLSFVLRWFGTQWAADTVMKSLFGTDFLKNSAFASQRDDFRKQILALDRVGLSRAVTGYIARHGVYDEISKIQIPTLILVGDHNVSALPEQARRIHNRIKGSKFVVVHGAGRTASIEEPETVSNIIQLFLNNLRTPAASSP
ncbi:MAG: alpha/beta fold hydrolase [Anaerolineae bacterium]|nr:alpha/beta fold hydrolase [Anaerolineae bacterium]